MSMKQIRLFVPTDPEPADAVIEQIALSLEKKYGGATVIPDATGHWAGITEPVSVIESVTAGADFDKVHLEELKEKVADQLDQQEVMATVNDVDVIRVSQ